jgi:uracil-DNA glycosylase
MASYVQEDIMTTSKALLREIFSHYSKSVGLNPRATYLHGTPIQPVVPLDTTVGGLFLLGAYPSARFATISRLTDVPVGDNLGPFENERWFDGSRIRAQPSAMELEEHFLMPLNISREDCWITDLVKVFLFKPGHVRRYQRLRRRAPAGYLRSDFYELGVRSLQWIEKELLAAKPRLLISLGAEVAGVLQGVRGSRSQIGLLVPEVRDLRIGRAQVPTIHCPHPGILMRGGSTPWLSLHRRRFIPAIRRYLASGSRTK